MLLGGLPQSFLVFLLDIWYYGWWWWDFLSLEERWCDVMVCLELVVLFLFQISGLFGGTITGESCIQKGKPALKLFSIRENLKNRFDGKNLFLRLMWNRIFILLDWKLILGRNRFLFWRNKEKKVSVPLQRGTEGFLFKFKQSAY